MCCPTRGWRMSSAPGIGPIKGAGIGGYYAPPMMDRGRICTPPSTLLSAGRLRRFDCRPGPPPESYRYAASLCATSRTRCMTVHAAGVFAVTLPGKVRRPVVMLLCSAARLPPLRSLLAAACSAKDQVTDKHEYKSGPRNRGGAEEKPINQSGLKGAAGSCVMEFGQEASPDGGETACWKVRWLYGRSLAGPLAFPKCPGRCLAGRLAPCCWSAPPRPSFLHRFDAIWRECGC